jgi:hypothetical protein
MWKSRIDKEPSPQFFADVVAYLSRAYPQAQLTRQRMKEMKPFLLAEWRNGQSAQDAAKATCACDGVNIVRSPATYIALEKRSVLPPKGAVRGDVFGVEDLREPRQKAKLLFQVALAAERARQESEAKELAAPTATAKAPGPARKPRKATRGKQEADHAACVECDHEKPAPAAQLSMDLELLVNEFAEAARKDRAT